MSSRPPTFLVWLIIAMPRYPELSEARTLHDLRTGPDGDLVAVCEDCSPLVDLAHRLIEALPHGCDDE